MFTKQFNKISKNDIKIAGGKGASLGEMIQNGISVPDGFVVLSDAFEKFLKETDLNVEIDTVLHTVDHDIVHTVEDASERIQSLILKSEIPKDISKKIKKEFKKLDSKFVAVRSSATAEDSLSEAWAGQLDSFLNTTEEDLLENVRKCWASLFTPRAIFYRFEKKLHKEIISVAVVIQKMVESEVSGIAFSVHPVTEDRNQIIIEAGFGLGEAIVSGSITPDSYVVEKEPRRIIDINVNVQNKKLVRSEKGGNEWIDLSKEEGEKQVLTEKQILELSELILKIENHYGVPQDIEWAFKEGKFYIVQSRPITTLKKNRISGESVDEYKKFMIRSFPLFFYKCWYQEERFGLPNLCGGMMFLDPIFIYKKNQGTDVLYNLSDELQIPIILISYFNRHVDKLRKLTKNYKKNYNNLIEVSKSQNISDIEKLKKIFSISSEMFAILTAMNLIGNCTNKNIGKEIVELSNETRKSTEDFVHISISAMLDVVNKILPKEYIKYNYFITYNEIVGKLPTIEELKKRKEGYIYYNHNIYYKNELNCFLKKFGFMILDEEKYEVKKIIEGNSAYCGKVKAKVKKIFEVNQIDKIKEGDVLVASMTTPDLILAMKKASAFVTDEGGLVCHAAIMAREMRKPCIIGTKIATQVLKDGDLVEVDADEGVVRILEN